MTDVLCRVDAGPSCGLGHLQRSLSLAQALRRQHGLETAVLAPALQDVRERVHHAGCEFVECDLSGCDLGSEADRLAVLQAAGRTHSETIVIDSYFVDERYLAAVRNAGPFLVVLDDRACHPFPAQLVVNGSAGAESLPYTSVSGDTDFLLGPRYVLLGAPFWHVTTRRYEVDATRVLVTVGGSDARGLLPRVVRALDALPTDLTITAVVGPYADTDAELPSARRQRLAVVRAPHSLHDVIMEADIAISAGGQTLYELAATGTPAVAIQAFDNQALNIRHLVAAGAARSAGGAGDSDLEERLCDAVAALIHDHDERAHMGRTGQALVDGRGALRVAGIIAARGSRPSS